MFDFFKRNKMNNSKSKYNALGAVEDYKEFKPYLEMLRDAINDGCTNIAITGPYGCGKSSVFKTFEAKQKELFNRTKKIIHVSLATFDGKNKDDDKFSLEIEKSILQQLFYKVKSNKIPFSRFNKISNILFIKTLLQVVALFITIFLALIIFKPNWVANILYNYKVYNIIASSFATIMLYIIFIALLLSLVTCFVRFLFKKIRISKFNLKSAEFEINDEDKSIFNKYLDEIIYFFEATKYEIVIIEDLDRFENTNIFIKLRELNYLINKSDHVKQTVSFVYAVGDSIFNDYERTKFFDYIIPIVPVVTRTNSGEKLLEIINDIKLGEELPKDYIYKVSVYIDDMRVLKNTVNEYLLYKGKIDIDLGDYIQLFSLMLYKNLYPHDFELIDKNDGILFNAIKNKTYEIDKVIEKKKIEVNEKSLIVERIDNELLEDVDELRISLMNRLRKYKPTHYRIRIDNKIYNLNNINEFKIDLESLINMKNLYYLNGNNSINETIDNKRFNNIFKHNFMSYYDRYLLIKDGKKNCKVKLLEEITKIEKEVESLAESSMQDYINNFGLFDTNISDLLLFMFREGYIKENYYDYISNFYNGRLTKADVEFILSVQNRKAKEFTYSLNKVDEIIERLEAKYFKAKETLNFDLLYFLIENNNKYNEKLNNLINQFIELDENKADFIKRHIESNNNSKEFIRLVCEKSRGIWGYLLFEENWTQVELDKILKIIILSINIEDIVKINECDKEYNGKSSKNALSNYIAQSETFFGIFNETEFGKEVNDINYAKYKFNLYKIETTLKELKIKFKQLDNNLSLKLLEYIINHNFYEINPDILNHIMNKLEKSYNKSFTCILNSNISSLTEYIENNIGIYLSNVYFENYKGVKEDECSIIRLLGLDVEDIQKQKIIKEVNFIPTSINKYDTELWALLLDKADLEFLWENVLSYYYEFALDEKLVSYLNKALGNKPINKINIEDEKTNYYDLIEDILLNHEISNNIVEKLLVDNLEYEEFEIEDADEDKVNILIDKKMIVFNIDNFNFISDYYNNCLIRFIEVNIEEYVEDIEQFDIGNMVFDLILSNKIIDDNKLKIMKHINNDEEYYFNHFEYAEAILDLLIRNEPNLKINSTLRKLLLEQDISSEKKIKFLVSQFNYFDRKEINDVLISAGGEYAEITAFTSKPIILTDSKVNQNIVNMLKKRNMISSFSEHKKGIRVNTYRKERS